MPASIARVLLLVCLIAHGIWVALEPITATDLWMALAAGRWIVDHRAVPSVDVFSYTVPGAPWFNQEWLSQVLFYAIYRPDRGTSLAALKIALVLGTLGLTAWLATRRSGSSVLAIVATIAATHLCRSFLDLRAQIFTFPAALIVLATLTTFRDRRDRYVLFVLPLLVAVWVNLHYGFIYGVGICILFVVVEAHRRVTGQSDHLAPREFNLLCFAVALAVGAALMNPQGIHALTFPFAVLGQGTASQDIIEWQPPVLFASAPFSPLAFWYYLVIQLGLGLVVLLWHRRSLDLFEVLLVVGTGVMALSSRRFIPLFALMATPFLAANLATIVERRQSKGP